MATLPSSTSRKFNPADYKNAPVWFTGRFLSQLNLFTDPIYTSLANGLTFQQNFNAQIYTINLTANALYTNNNISFTSTINGTPVGVILLAKNVANNLSTPVISPVEFSWFYNAGAIVITGISGLTPSVTYKLTWMVF